MQSSVRILNTLLVGTRCFTKVLWLWELLRYVTLYLQFQYVSDTKQSEIFSRTFLSSFSLSFLASLFLFWFVFPFSQRKFLFDTIKKMLYEYVSNLTRPMDLILKRKNREKSLRLLIYQSNWCGQLPIVVHFERETTDDGERSFFDVTRINE